MIPAPPGMPSDEALADRSRAGVLSAFEELVRRHEAAIYRYVCQRCGDPDEARDLTQAAFVAAFRKLDGFNGRSSFRSWLFAIARNRTIDHLRGRRPQEPVDPERLVAVDDPARSIETREDAEALWAFVRAELGPEQFEVLWLRYQEDLSLKEIARATGRTLAGIKVLLFRARRRLAGRLGDAPGSVRDARPRGTSVLESFHPVQHPTLTSP